MATSFRSTWVTSSIAALQRRGFFERYAGLIAEADRLEILGCAPASWLPAALVVRHYEACERLSLPNETLLEIGADVTQRVHAPALALGRSVATASGVTPWTILGKFDRLWARVSAGGALAVAKLGPKEARVEVLSVPIAHLRYNRVATRGILLGIVSLFCKSAWVHEITPLCTRTTLGYRVQWA